MVDPLQVNTFYFIKIFDRFFHTAAMPFKILWPSQNIVYEYEKIANKKNILNIINLRRKTVKEKFENCHFMTLIEKKIDYKWK